MVFSSGAFRTIALSYTLANCAGTVSPQQTPGSNDSAISAETDKDGDTELAADTPPAESNNESASGEPLDPVTAIDSAPGTELELVPAATDAIALGSEVPLASAVISDGSVVARASASRVRGVAPLAVLFDATASTGAARPFHDLHYSWTFDDVNAGKWASTGHGKNSATGAVAAHVFEEPGRYQVRVTVRDAKGKGSTASVTIDVENPDTYWATKTTCVSSNTTFTGCPAGAQKLTTTRFADIVNAVRPGRRVLLRRGDQWAANGTLSLEGSSPGMLGAFGSCTTPDARGICANAPVLTSNQGDAIIAVQDDWRVMDLKLTGKTDGTQQNGIEIYGGTGTLLYRLRSVGFNLGVTASFIQDQLAVIDSDFGRAYTNQANLASERLMVLGNHIHESSMSHVLRIWHAYKSVVSENLIESSSVSTSDGRHALKIHGLGEGDGGEGTGLDEATTPAGEPAHRTELTIIADNTFGASPPWPVSIGPQNTQSDERLSNIILERNFWRTSGKKSSSAPPLDTGIHCTAVSDVTIRNNIFDATGAASGYAALDVSKSDGIPVYVSRIHFLNNLIYRRDNAGGTVTMVRAYPDVHDTVIRNNLGVATGYSAANQRVVEDEAAGTVALNNSFMNISFASSAPTLPAQFRPAAGAASIGKGTNGIVIDDYARAVRPAIGTDLGPYENVTP